MLNTIYCSIINAYPSKVFIVFGRSCNMLDISITEPKVKYSEILLNDRFVPPIIKKQRPINMMLRKRLKLFFAKYNTKNKKPDLKIYPTEKSPLSSAYIELEYRVL